MYLAYICFRLSSVFHRTLRFNPMQSHHEPPKLFHSLILQKPPTSTSKHTKVINQTPIKPYLNRPHRAYHFTLASWTYTIIGENATNVTLSSTLKPMLAAVGGHFSERVPSLPKAARVLKQKGASDRRRVSAQTPGKRSEEGLHGRTPAVNFTTSSPGTTSSHNRH